MNKNSGFLNLFTHFLKTRRCAYTVIAIAYFIYLIIFSFLTFPLKEDEPHFWKTSESFSHSMIPTLELISDYNDLNTPLPFIIFGQLEFMTGNGIISGRYLNFLLSFAMLFLIIFLAQNNFQYPVLLILPLLINPYIILTSNYLYTDIIAVFFVFTGLLSYLKKKYFLSMLLFFLGISSRQYMVAFPAALLVYETLRLFEIKSITSFFNLIKSFFYNRAVLTMLLSSLSIFIWFFIFEDFGPKTALRNQIVLTAQKNTLIFQNSLIFLSSVAIYFVIPELILFSRKTWNQIKPGFFQRSLYISLAALIILFIIFPPVANKENIARFGIVDWIFRLLSFPDLLRVIIYCCFAMVTVIRFFKIDLASILVFVNTLLMLKAHVAWEKYTLPLVVILYLLKAIGEIDNPERQPLAGTYQFPKGTSSG